MSSSEILRTLEAATRGSFQETRDRFFWWLAVSTIIVVVGVIIEEFEYVISWRWIRRLLPLKVLLPVHWIETFARRISKLGWLLIILGVAGEGAFEGLVSKADGWLQDFNNTISASQEAEIKQLGDVAARARLDAEAAKAASNEASAAARRANGLALSARQEADSFEKDIASAKQQSADATSKAAAAESHLADALERAENAEKELHRLESPRTFTDPDGMAQRLQAFKGTEYRFASVFGDGESRELLKKLAAILVQAQWARVKQSVMHLGVPSFPIFANDDFVDLGAWDGVVVSVESKESLESIQDTLVNKLPLHIQVAIFLNDVIFANLSPPPGEKPKVDLKPGDSTVIAINIGRKQ